MHVCCLFLRCVLLVILVKVFFFKLFYKKMELHVNFLSAAFNDLICAATIGPSVIYIFGCVFYTDISRA